MTRILKILKPAPGFNIDLPIKSQEELEEITSRLNEEDFSSNLVKQKIIFIIPKCVTDQFNFQFLDKIFITV